MYGLTPRQHAMVSFIEEYSSTHGYAPSYREIRTHFGLASLGTVYKHVQILIKKGALSQLKGHGRSLASTQVSEAAAAVCMLPLVGCLRAGHPVEMLSVPQQIALPAAMVSDSQITYLLRASDDTLQEELIACHDLLIVEVRPPMDAGEVIVGIVNGCEVLVKRYYRNAMHIRLEGHNSQHAPIILNADYLEVLGVVKGILRFYASTSSGSGS